MRDEVKKTIIKKIIKKRVSLGCTVDFIIDVDINGVLQGYEVDTVDVSMADLCSHYHLFGGSDV